MAIKTEPEVDLLSEFRGPLVRSKCSVMTALDTLDEAQREKVERACESPEITGTMIARRLSEWSSVKIGGYTVSRHRRKECSCE